MTKLHIQHSQVKSPICVSTLSASKATLRSVASQSLLVPQQTLGNQAMQRLLHSRVIQAKLAINAPGDQYEQEADSVAEQVVSATPSPILQRKCACGGAHHADGECAECQKKRLSLQKQAMDHSEIADVPPIVHEVLRSPGQSLDAATRKSMERRFGYDFGQVRIHSDRQAVESARALNALAYTVGQNVVFGAGQYTPETRSGQKLVAHELTHVVQQGMGLTVPNRIYRQRGPVSVRFPTLEVAALRGQEAFAVIGQPLTSGELSLARSVFHGSINLSRVRIVYSPLISAPTTLGNTIRVPPASSMSPRVLIHELTHIWQFQTKGAEYISDSAFHQTVAFLMGGNPGAAYNYAIIPGMSFHEYTAEQQASIVEDYFAYPSLQQLPDYQRLIDEVRTATPISAPSSFFEELAAGLPPRGALSPSLPDDIHRREGTNVPLIEVRFPGL